MSLQASSRSRPTELWKRERIKGRKSKEMDNGKREVRAIAEEEGAELYNEQNRAGLDWIGFENGLRRH